MRKKTLNLLFVCIISVSFASCEKKIEKTKSSQPAKVNSNCDSVKAVSIMDRFCVDGISDYVLTKYFYLAADGTKYPIYHSGTGKCFIIRTNTKTGEKYRKYLPEVDKQLNGE